MSPVRGKNNVPHTVVEGVQAIADLRGVSEEEMREQVRSNYRDLFGH